MFKKILTVTALISVIGVLIFGAVNRTLARNENGGAGTGGNRRNNLEAESALGQAEVAYGQGKGGNGRRGGADVDRSGQGVHASQSLAASGGLSAEGTAALLYMREEEKLAHDVYVTLYKKWGLPVFQNISQSEQTHTEAVKALLDRNALPDPAQSGVGVFTNPDLQALYNELTARGEQSLAEALKAGAAIEEMDILDLQERLAQTNNADVQQVFTNLLEGSYNHLRAFTSTLSKQTGETYQPQYLSIEAYQAIVGSNTGTGSRGRGAGQSGGGWRGGRP